jgi:multidrug resistance efflux pump
MALKSNVHITSDWQPCVLLLIAATVSMVASEGRCDEATKAAIQVNSLTTVLIRQAEIAAREAGTLKTLSVQAGQTIEEGTLLATLDDEPQELAVALAELNVQIATLKADNQLPVETAQALIREAEQEKLRLEIAARISEKQSAGDVAIRLAEKNREVADFELQRARKAREAFNGSISNAELNRLQVLYDQRTLEIEEARDEHAVAALKSQSDQVAVQQQQEAVARSKLLASEREQEQRVARGSLDVARNELSLAKLKLARRRIVAPFNATVAAVSRQEGEWLEPGTVLLRLIQLDRLRVEGFVTATQAMKIRAGQNVVIRFPDSDLESVEGAITFVSPRSNRSISRFESGPSLTTRRNAFDQVSLLRWKSFDLRMRTTTFCRIVNPKHQKNKVVTAAPGSRTHADSSPVPLQLMHPGASQVLQCRHDSPPDIQHRRDQ